MPLGEKPNKLPDGLRGEALYGALKNLEADDYLLFTVDGKRVTFFAQNKVVMWSMSGKSGPLYTFFSTNNISKDALFAQVEHVKSGPDRTNEPDKNVEPDKGEEPDNESSFVPYPPEPPFGHRTVEQLVQDLQPVDTDGKPLEGEPLLTYLYDYIKKRWGLSKTDILEPDTWLARGYKTAGGPRNVPETEYVRLFILKLEGVKGAHVTRALHLDFLTDDEVEASRDEDLPVARIADIHFSQKATPVAKEIATYVRDHARKIHGLIFPHIDTKTGEETNMSWMIGEMCKELNFEYRSELFDLTERKRTLPTIEGKGFLKLETAIEALYRVVKGEPVGDVQRDLAARLSRSFEPGEDAKEYNPSGTDVSVLRATVLSEAARQKLNERNGGMRTEWVPDIARALLDGKSYTNISSELHTKGYKGGEAELSSFIFSRGKRAKSLILDTDMEILTPPSRKSWGETTAMFIYHYTGCTAKEAVRAARIVKQRAGRGAK